MTPLSNFELKTMLEALVNAISRENSWKPEEMGGKLRSSAMRQQSLLTQALRIEAKDKALDEAEVLLSASGNNSLKTKVTKEKPRGQPQYSTSLKKEWDAV